MFAFLFQSLTSLILVGVIAYVVSTCYYLKKRKQAQKALLGTFIGLMVISLGMSAIPLAPDSASFDIKSGPLIFAGYLAGPIGALLAGLCAALFRVSLGEPFLMIGILMNFSMPFIGLGVCYLRPPSKWHITRLSATCLLVAGFFLLQLVSFVFINGFDQGLLSPWLGIAISGTVSILVTWQIINMAFRFANEANQSAALAKKLDLALNTSGAGMFEYLAEGSIALLDARTVELYGLSHKPLQELEDYPGWVSYPQWENLVYPDDLPKVRENTRQVLSGEKPHGRFDFRGIRADGKLLYIRSTWGSELNADGSVHRTIGMHSDVTDIRAAEQRHLDMQRQVAVIAQNLPGTLLEIERTDSDHFQLLNISAKCKNILGYSDREFYDDQSLFEKIHDPADLKVLYEVLNESRTSGEPVNHRCQITTREGQIRWLDYHGSFVLEDGREIVKSIVLDATTEVEAQRQMEQEREISRRALRVESIGQLTGGVAHDFNNLLAVILSNLELLREVESPSQQKELIDTAIVTTMQGADLTRSMLSFARKASLKPVVLNLNNVVREARTWIGRTLPESVVVKTSLLAGLWRIEVDRSSMESVLLNLILNARDAMDGQGSLTIETANIHIDETYICARDEDLTPGRYAVLAISDTGSGIADSALGSIFEPFFTTKPPGVGTGLGLSMTVGFMKQSGGSIQVYTEPGKGTTFKLYFPVTNSAHHTQSTPDTGEQDSEGFGKRLLVAEDEKAVRTSLVIVLEMAGYKVTAAASGDEAFSIYEADPAYDILLTDIVMPGELQGADLAKAVREITPDQPVVFMSGYANEAMVHGNGLHPDDIRLMKPAQRSDILAAIERAISKSSG